MNAWTTTWTTYDGSMPCSACARQAMSTPTGLITHRATWTRINNGAREFACHTHKGVKTK